MIIIFLLITYKMNKAYGLAEISSIQPFTSEFSIYFQSTLQELQTTTIPLISYLHSKPLVNCQLLPQKAAYPEPKYQSVLLGGTFDYLHIGHQILLLSAALQARKKILVGVTSQSMLIKKKHSAVIQPINIRIKAVKDYLRMIKPGLDIIVLQINDPFGPAITQPDFDAIVVSIQTKAGGQKINEIRNQRQMKKLTIQICPLMSESQMIQGKISSTQTRAYILNKNKVNEEEFVNYRGRWKMLCQKICKYFGVNQNFEIQSIWFDKIVKGYSQHWRFYHTNHHIYELLIEFHKREWNFDFNELQNLGVEISIWFHDFVYIPISKDNEEKSAKRAIEFIQSLIGVKEQVRQLCLFVEEAILATKSHESSKRSIQQFIDLDMGILDSDQEVYSQYSNNIRFQYESSTQNYCKKRTTFLRSLKLDKVFYHRKPINLQTNILREIKRLQQEITQNQL